MITENHFRALKYIIDNSTQDQSYVALNALMTDDSIMSKTLDGLHKEINAILDEPLQRRSRFKRVFRIGRSENTVELLHSRLRKELNGYIHAQKPTPQPPAISIHPGTPTGAIETPPYMTSSGESSRSTSSDNSSIRSIYMIPEFASGNLLLKDSFNNLLLIQYSRYKEPCDENLIHNAMIILMGHYAKHVEEQKNDLISKEQKQFHRLRLLSLVEWTTTHGFKAFAEAVKTFQKNIDIKNIALSLIVESSKDSEEDIKIKYNKHQLLNWVEIISDTEKMKIAESPAAIRFILRYIAETENPDERYKADYIKKLVYFKSFFLGSTFADINIQSHLFDKRLAELQKPQNDQSWEEFTHQLNAIRKDLLNIYDELVRIWVPNAKTSERFLMFDLSKYVPTPDEEKCYQQSLANALKFSVQTLESSRRRRTNQSDEPLSSSTRNMMCFTPQEWDIINYPDSSKRLSTRSGRESSKSPTLLSSRALLSVSSLNSQDHAAESNSTKSHDI